jgi:alpha-glucosidase (family GH31 glycosyl hydrolase)
MHNSFKIVDHSTKWGLGERFQSKFKITDGKWTLWNRDKPWKIDRGIPGTSDQTYGFQPIYLARNTESKKHHLVYFKNTYGLLVDVSNKGNQLQYNSVGGPIHFIIIVGEESPEKVIQQYHDFIGPSLVPPFWSMGYHQCRWGYKTADKLIEVLTKFKENDLPIDTIWSDLDYMDKKMIFTVNTYTHGDKLNKLIKDH